MGNYIPDTAAIRKEMLQAIGKESIDALYEDVPSNVRLKELHIPEGKTASKRPGKRSMRSTKKPNRSYAPHSNGMKPFFGGRLN